MRDKIQERFKTIKSEGSSLDLLLHPDDYWVNDSDFEPFQSWIFSAANLIHLVAPASNPIFKECERLLSTEELGNSIPTSVFRKMKGLVNSTHIEWSNGLLRGVEYMFAAEAFDDFLDHASEFHKGGKTVEASVLASSVLEDTVKKIAKKFNVNFTGRTVEPIVEELKKADVFNAVKAKKIKHLASIRNHALHAEWGEFDIRDVGELISGTRDLIEEFL